MSIAKSLTIRPLYERSRFHTSVISEVENQTLRDSYTFCRKVTRKHAKTFYLATRFLPTHKQRAVFAVYALCRFIDDTVDECVDLQSNTVLNKSELELKLDNIRFQVNQAFEFEISDNHIFNAIVDTLKYYNISKRDVELLIEGVYQDLFKNRFANFDELYDYSYKVASVVGLMTSEIFGYKDKIALKYAVDLGIAMQLTNILRDVGEDLERDRIYLPQDELDAYNISEADLRRGEMTPAIRSFMKFQVDRAREYYKSAEKGIKLLNRDSRLPVWLARLNYARILDKIEASDYKVFKKRVFLSTTEKLKIVPSSLFRSYIL